MTRHHRRRAAFWVRQWFNALAPSNFLLTNPVALRKFYETNGGNVLPLRRSAGADGRAVLEYRHHAFAARDAQLLPAQLLRQECPGPEERHHHRRPLDRLAAITQPQYAVGADEDHITPRRGTFKTCTLIAGPARHALSTSGHILGIINPPVSPPKRAYWAGDYKGETDGKQWRGQREQAAGSWWQDWASWMAQRCEPLQAPPPLHSESYPALCPAPGTYVLER